MITKTQESYLEQFSISFTQGLESIAKAASIYVKAIDESHSMKGKFIERFAGVIPAGAWANFEAVGRKTMHPRIMLGVGRNTSFIKRLPFSDQEDIVNGKKVELLTADGDSLPVDARDISAHQSRQLFAGNHIRTLSEQRAFIEDDNRIEKDNAVELAKIIRYRIENGNVHFAHNTVFTMNELITITAELASTK